jgi:hypothetical protein
LLLLGVGRRIPEIPRIPVESGKFRGRSLFFPGRPLAVGSGRLCAGKTTFHPFGLPGKLFVDTLRSGYWVFFSDFVTFSPFPGFKFSMEQKERLEKAMLSMLSCIQKKDEKECYRYFFALDVPDRRIVQEAFKAARKKYPTAAARKDAKAIYDLIQRNFKKEVHLMIDSLESLLEHWFWRGKEVFYEHFTALTSLERELILDGLRDVIGKSDNEEFRQAAKDIPVYIRSRQ